MPAARVRSQSPQSYVPSRCAALEQRVDPVAVAACHETCELRLHHESGDGGTDKEEGKGSKQQVPARSPPIGDERSTRDLEAFACPLLSLWSPGKSALVRESRQRCHGRFLRRVHHCRIRPIAEHAEAAQLIGFEDLSHGVAAGNMDDQSDPGAVWHCGSPGGARWQGAYSASQARTSWPAATVLA